MRKLVRTNVTGFFKDPKSNVIINTDTTRLNSAKYERDRKRQEKIIEAMVQRHEQELKELRDKIEVLEKNV